MALISSGGGRLRIPVPRMPHGAGPSTFSGPKPVRLPKPKAPPRPKQPIVKAPAPPKSAAAGQKLVNPAGGGNDPFQFIKSLLISTNPADAKALIDQVYAPIRQQYLDQIAQIDGMAKARADQMSQVYQAFAGYLQGLPGQIQGIYGQTNAYQQGAQAGSALAGMAGPQGAVGSHIAASSQINADLEAQLGKNWAAYAAAQPGIYSLMATQNIKSMLGDAQATEAKLRSDLLSLSSKEASDILAYLENAQAKDTSLQEWAYGQKQSLTAAQEKNAQGYLGQAMNDRQIAYNNAIISGKTPAQAQAAADKQWRATLQRLERSRLITWGQFKAYSGAPPALSGPKTTGASSRPKVSVGLSKAYGYLVDAYGNPVLNAKGQQIPLPTAATATKRSLKIAPEYVSKQYGVLMGIDENGQLVALPGPDGRPQPYVPGKGAAPKAPKGAKAPKAVYGPKDLGSAQKYIQNDISTRNFKTLQQAIVYYLNAYGGLVRAGYRAQIKRYVRQAWATRVAKKKTGGGGIPSVQ